MAMKKIKTAEATGRVLDYLIAKALGHHKVVVRTWEDITDTLDPEEDADLIAFHRERKTVRVSSEQIPGGGMFPVPRYSTDWAQGGPIIRKYHIDLLHCRFGDAEHEVLAQMREGEDVAGKLLVQAWARSDEGPERDLIAAMRCLVIKELGDEVEVPEELT